MKAMDSSSLRIGAWRVDPALDQISKDGSTVKLERRAMQLLLYLAEHAGQTVSVEQLLDQVWTGVVVTPDSVYHAVAALRRTLGDDSHDPIYIANVPRRGYRLIAPVAAPDVGPREAGESSALAGGVGIKSIAVLPFADMSEKKDQEYFADGMAEEIRDLLAKIPSITVIGRSSSSQFKGKNEDLRKIGTELSVAYLLEGSVRKSGDRVRVAAQLIDARDGTRLWSGTYDRDLDDVLKMQDEIAAALVRALRITVGASEMRSRPMLTNAEAYNLYLRGRFAFDRFDKEGFEEAAGYFRQVVELDPESALAPAWLAIAYTWAEDKRFVEHGTGFEEARRYAERALVLDPQSELATGALGLIHVFNDWDWSAATTELDRALALAPGSARTLLFHSFASYALGKWATAIRDLNASAALDPLSPAANFRLGRAYLGAGHWSEAEVALRRALEIGPNYAFTHFYLATALLFRRENEAALKQIDLEPVKDAQWAGRVAINYALGRRSDSDAALERLTELASADWAYGIACVHAYRAESDAAFVWLERAFTQKDANLWAIKGEPLLRPLKGDPRYRAFLRKMNLPE